VASACCSPRRPHHHHLQSLLVADLSKNELQGALPAFPPALQALEVSNNRWALGPAAAAASDGSELLHEAAPPG
jgi:hypothetical protein